MNSFYTSWFILLLLSLQTNGQVKPLKDTLNGTGEEIVVTANRSERKLSNVAVPTQLVSRKRIQQTGSLKVQDVLQEQTGLVIVNSTLGTSLNGYPNPFGQGVQMLGLDPSYTAILLDGEPLIGRNAGILKLGRLATGNIRQIEIVKGPSSSLYGSEAMAGVINMITETPQKESIDLQLHQASNQTWGTTLSYSNRFHKTGVQFFVNRYATGGYDLDPSIYGKTIVPSRDWSGQLKITQEISKNGQLLFSFRNYDSKQENNYQIFWQNSPAIVRGFTTEQDRSAFAQLKWMLKPGTRVYFRTFFDRYINNSFVHLENTSLQFDETSFDQTLVKPEIQFEKSKAGYSQLVAGMGAAIETIDASRYAGFQKLSTLYAFTQKEWYLLRQQLTLISGVRLDKRTDFDLHISPRLAVAYQPGTNWKFTASAGWGFKAPDFRHMLLNFYNAQIGYSLLGTNTLSNELQKLQQLGLLQPGVNISPYITGGNLKPETSFGIHLGTKYTQENWILEAGLFRNDISNLIDVYALPFTRSNGLAIYSYHNVSNVYTQGLELDIRHKITDRLSIAMGYQYLLAKDKEVLANINREQVYKRDPVNFQTTKVSAVEYFGLANRSRHTGNFKILYEKVEAGFDTYIRAIYRGKFGFTDVNGNNIIDDEREMTNGYTLLNMAASKTIGKHFRLQTGIENVFNFTNPSQLPNIAGRLFFLNINYSIQNLFNKEKNKDHEN